MSARRRKAGRVGATFGTATRWHPLLRLEWRTHSRTEPGAEHTKVGVIRASGGVGFMGGMRPSRGEMGCYRRG